MPGFVLHSGASVLCVHGGQATPAMTMPRVLVSGQPVAVQGTPYLIAGCPLLPPAPGPCVTGQWLAPALRVTALGMPLLIAGSPSVCAPSGTPMLVVAAQGRVSAM